MNLRPAEKFYFPENNNKTVAFDQVQLHCVTIYHYVYTNYTLSTVVLA